MYPCCAVFLPGANVCRGDGGPRGRGGRLPGVVHAQVALHELLHGDLAVVVRVQFAEDDSGAVGDAHPRVGLGTLDLNCKHSDLLVGKAGYPMYEYILHCALSTLSVRVRR